jgi:hypothetical protein
VYLSHAALAKYLNQAHSIRALEILADKQENSNVKTPGGNVPFNFTFVKIVAKLYHYRRLDRAEID